MAEIEPRGRKHFNTKQNFPFGSENEFSTKPTQNNEKSNSNMKKTQQKLVSNKYGDWWVPVAVQPKDLPQQNFHGKIRYSTPSRKVQMSGIAGFSLGGEDEQSNNFSKVVEKQCMLKDSGDLEDEGICSEDSFVEQQIQEEQQHQQKREATSPSQNKSSLSNFHSRESLQFAGEDLIREAQSRALERQKSARCESSNFKEAPVVQTEREQETKSGTFSQDQRKPAGISSSASSTYGHNSSQQFMHLTQKQLLEQRMVGSQTKSYAYQPPWYTNADDKSPKNKRSVGLSSSKEITVNSGVLKSSTQLDYPMYTTQEISAARPLMLGSRNEKCTWLPNMAPDLIINRRARKPYQAEQEICSNGDAPTRENSAVKSNDRAYPAYGHISAPYASHE